jgi:hypothetical protein
MDIETKLIYMQARYYDPGRGRFVSEDSERQGLNWYVYCDNHPANEVDKTGCSPSFSDGLTAWLGCLAGLIALAGILFLCTVTGWGWVLLGVLAAACLLIGYFGIKMDA